jgi:uncharacterized protein (TIGR02996 family)
MTDDAFLQAILAAPEDDQLRLVYADSLTERGDPRGDFIRVQCELARLPDEDPRRPALEAREQALLADHQDAWLGPLQPLLLAWTFRRGFLEEIVMDARDYETHAAMIHRIAPIRMVTTVSGGGGGERPRRDPNR